MNKIAIVTGASQGIGRGIALKLAKEGYDIAFSFFSATQRAEELCAEIQSTTAQRCAMYCVDMRKDGAGAKFVNQVSEEMGVPCVLVNNAGRTRMESILDMTPETVDELINLDLKNYLFCMQAAATQMVRAKISGSIINITSTRAERAYPCDAVYGGVKAALNRASQSAALDLAPYGIRVNCVAPGAIAVRSKEYLQKLSIIPVDFWDELGTRIPLGRSGTPEDIANAVAFLASDQASYITGEILRVDGGLILPGMPEHVLPEEDFNGWSKAHSLFAEEVFKRIV